MRTFTAAVILLLGFALMATTTTVSATDLDQALRNMVEQTIREMDDPMAIESLDVEDFEAFGLVTLNGVIQDLRIQGIHNIDFQRIQMDINTAQVSVDVLIPQLTFDATYYDLTGRFGALIPIFGNGRVSIAINNLRVQGTATLKNDQFVSLSSFKSTTTLGSMTSNFENLLMGGELGDLMNYIIGDMVPFVIRNQQNVVAAALEEMVLERANESLEGTTMEDLLERIMEFA